MTSVVGHLYINNPNQSIWEPYLLDHSRHLVLKFLERLRTLLSSKKGSRSLPSTKGPKSPTSHSRQRSKRLCVGLPNTHK